MANITETRTWFLALGNTTNSVADVIIRKGVLLEEIEDLEPSDIKVMCQTSRRSGGTVFIMGADPTVIPRPVIPNPGVIVPGLLELKVHTTVSAANYYYRVGREVITGIMTCARVNQYPMLY